MGTLHEVSNAGIVDFKEKGSTGLVLEQGTSDPVSGTEGQIFYRTDTEELKIHNGINFAVLSLSAGGGWQDNGDNITLLTNTDQVRIGDGSSGVPAIGFENDVDTGLFSVSADIFGFAIGGSERMRITATQVAIGISGTSDGFLHLHNATAGTVTARTDANGLVIENSTTTGISILTPNTQAARIAFGDPENNDVGQIAYFHSTDEMEFSAGGTTVMNVSTTQAIFRDGSAAFPALSFILDKTTGLHRVGLHNLGIATNGILRLDVSNTLVTSTLPYAAPGGAPGATAYSFAGDLDSGMYRLNSNNIGFAAGGTKVMEYTPDALYLIAGTVSLPGYSFFSDSDTGFYWEAANKFHAVTAGASLMEFSSGGVVMSKGRFFNTDGGVATPAYSFNSDPNLGLYRSGIDAMSVATGGALRATFSNAGMSIFSGQLLLDDRSAAGPSYSWNNDTNTGVYRIGIDNMGFATAGTLKLDISTTAVTSTLPFYAPNGNSGSPAYTFAGDTNTGLFWVSANKMSLAVNGNPAMTISSGNVTFHSLPVLPANDDEAGASIGSASKRWDEIFSANDIINTSHSSTKYDIVDLENLEVPPAVMFKRKKDKKTFRDGKTYIGYLNDGLPVEARAIDKEGTIDAKGNYNAAVVGILCGAVRKLQEEILVLKEKI